MADYSNTVIYKIICNDASITDCYVGHTTNFIKRKSQHKTASSNESNNLKVYSFIRSNGGWTNFSMIQIEAYPCETKEQALKRERHFIEELKASLNIVIPTRTNKEYRIQNKDKKLQYIEANKEHIRLQKHEYHQQNKDKHRAYKKQYQKDNREKYLDMKHREYQNRSHKFICECGSTITKHNQNKHLKTKTHIAFIASKLI